MPVMIVRLGSKREAGEGIRIGTVRRPPRGVLKTDYARLDFYDSWLPQLAPSSELLSWIKSQPENAASWRVFETKYVRELSSPDNQRLLELLCGLSRQTDFSIGCYCEDESKCHRSVLRKILEGLGAVMK
jgi:uncharacterized protein YeaO (DUF488 family)